jgi:hypothetical protein
MSDRAAVIAALTEYANKPATSHECRAESGEIFGARPLVSLMRYAQSLDTRTELNELLAEVAPLIRVTDSFRAGVMAINCGTLVEMGGDPAIVFPHLLAVLPQYLATARRATEQKKKPPETIFADDPDVAKASAGLSFLMLCTMTVICRKMECRQALRANVGVVEGIAALRAHNREADFVSQVLDYTDGIEILVLAPETRQGFRFALEAINNNFHLFTMVQSALILGEHMPGDPPDPEMYGIATGETPQPQVRLDYARWHFYSWDGLQPDGKFAATDFRTWISGNAKPTEIPTLDGTRIAILGPMVLGRRSWNSNEFACIHDALRSRADIVEVLSDEQVAMWLDKIQHAKR